MLYGIQIFDCKDVFMGLSNDRWCLVSRSKRRNCSSPLGGSNFRNCRQEMLFLLQQLRITVEFLRCVRHLPLGLGTAEWCSASTSVGQCLDTITLDLKLSGLRLQPSYPWKWEVFKAECFLHDWISFFFFFSRFLKKRNLNVVLHHCMCYLWI